MKGPRHGGANLKVSGMMRAVIEEIGYCENDIEIKALIYRILHKQFYDYSGLVYGMGHAIYTLSDPRSEVLQEYIEKLAEKKGKVKEYEFYQRFEPVSYTHLDVYKRQDDECLPPGPLLFLFP